MATNDLNSTMEILKVLAAIGSVTGLCAAILCWKSPELMKVVLTFIRDILRDRRNPPRPPKDRTKKASQNLEGALDSQILAPKEPM
jgi:hypothetical protein